MKALAVTIRAFWVAVGLCCSAVSAVAQSQPASVSGSVAVAPVAGDNSASRLEALRNAMIDQALDAPVQISSNAWLDESGRLRHVSRFFSEVRARAAADLIASSESAAEARATAALAAPDQSAAQSAKSATEGRIGRTAADIRPEGGGAVPGRSSAESSLPGESPAKQVEGPECRQDRTGLLRAASLRFDVSPDDGRRGNAVLHDLRTLIQDSLARESGRGGLTITTLDQTGVDSYSRLITFTGQHDSPYRIMISIHSPLAESEPQGRGVQPGQTYLALSLAGARRTLAELEQPATPAMPDRQVEVELALIEVSGERTLLRHRLPILIPGSSPTHNYPRLPDSTAADIRLAVLSWWSEAVSQLRCEPILVQANPVGASVVSIPVGGRAGIRIGDRWMIADRAKIPARVLEQGSIDRIMMAEVIAVGQYRSTLRLTAESAASPVRPGLERGVPWFATPL